MTQGTNEKILKYSEDILDIYLKGCLIQEDPILFCVTRYKGRPTRKSINSIKKNLSENTAMQK